MTHENRFSVKLDQENTAQWVSFSKKLQKLIILDPGHIFLFPIQGKGKIARGIRIWTENYEKSLFSGSKRPFCDFDHNDRSH
jgi:hypothetical protein